MSSETQSTIPCALSLLKKELDIYCLIHIGEEGYHSLHIWNHIGPIVDDAIPDFLEDCKDLGHTETNDPTRFKCRSKVAKLYKDFWGYYMSYQLAHSLPWITPDIVEERELELAEAIYRIIKSKK